MKQYIEDIKNDIERNKVEEALQSLNNLINKGVEDADIYYLRGVVWQKKGDFGKAITDFNLSKKLDPEGVGASALEMANEILDFFNPDNFNP